VKITQVNDRVHMATGTNVNWALVTDGDGVTLVDAGYPNDHKALFASLAHIGRRPEGVHAIVLTHAHLDHIGGIPAFRDRYPVPVFTGEEEARHARREYVEQITPAQMLRQCTRRAGRRWVGQTLRAVLPHLSMSVTDITGTSAGIPLDIPGGLVPIATPGHTRGHTAWLMPSTGVIFTGDALVTDHPISNLDTGPQILPAVFNEDEQSMLRSLQAISGLPADTVVPGHGPHLRGDLADLMGRAVARATNR
jgi:glyoxylase-like metal-dependent hydrolase (beta-lactamase superfamily II)